MIPASRLVRRRRLPFATATSICRGMFTICSGVCFIAFPSHALSTPNFFITTGPGFCAADHRVRTVNVAPGGVQHSDKDIFTYLE